MKLSVFCFISCALWLAASTGHAQGENHGVVHLQGRILSPTCAVESHDNPEVLGAIVPMGAYSAKQFPRAESVVGGDGRNGRMQFRLSDCPEHSRALQVKLEAELVPGSHEKIRLQDSDAENVAKNIAIHIYGGASPMPLNLNQTYRYDIDSASHSSHINLLAKYVSTGDEVVVGNASAVINYRIIYP